MLGFYSRFEVVPARSVNGESVLLPNAYLLAANGHLRESGGTGVRTAFRIRDATAYVIYSCEPCERMVSSKL